MKHCLTALLLVLCCVLPACGEAPETDAPADPPGIDQAQPATPEAEDADADTGNDTDRNSSDQTSDTEQPADTDPSTWTDPVVVTLINELAYRYLQDPDAVEEPAELDGHGPVVILLNDSRIENHMFAAALNTLAEQDPARPVLIRADQSLYFSTLAPFFDTISNSDFAGPMHMNNITPIEMDLTVPAPDESEADQEDVEEDDRVRAHLSVTLNPAQDEGQEDNEPSYSYMLNGQAIAFDMLGQAMQSLAQDNPDIELVLNVDPRVGYSTFVQIVSLANDAGITQIAIATRADGETGTDGD